MIYQIDANLLEFEPIEGLLHQANCFCTMGAGIAARIKEKYPEAYAADLKTKRGDRAKLGTFSSAFVERDKKTIYNVYGQYDFGGDRRYTSYDALDDGFRRVRVHAEQNGLKTIGIPRNMGCRLAGGTWEVVSAIAHDVFKDAEFDLYICNYGN